jgi:hypothetical protein
VSLDHKQTLEPQHDAVRYIFEKENVLKARKEEQQQLKENFPLTRARVDNETRHYKIRLQTRF